MLPSRYYSAWSEDISPGSHVKAAVAACRCCSVARSCPILWKPMDCSTPAFPVLHCLLELAPIHVHWVAIQPSHSLSSPSPLPSIFPRFRVFSMSQFFASGGQSTKASAWTSVLPVNIQGWFALGLTGLISLLSRGLSRIFSSTTIWKHPLFGAQPSLWSNFHIHTSLLENHSFDYV